MVDLLQQLDQIKDQAQTLVTDIARNAPAADLHASALDMLLNIVNTRNNAALSLARTAGPSAPPSARLITEDVVSAEIARVGRKLPRWASNQDQINSRILTLFLQLAREGHSPISEEALGAAYGDTAEFQRNFMQMKAIAPNNHAKVFDVANNIVSIWEPVKVLVKKYEEMVLGEAGPDSSETRDNANPTRGLNMEKKLNSVGKQAFVDHYKLFEQHAKGFVSREDAVAQLVDQGVSNDAGAAIRVGNAKAIFDHGWEHNALRVILASQRLPHKVLAKAKGLLG